MTSYAFVPGVELTLDRWHLTHEPRTGPAMPAGEVTVPHSAMTALVDARSGGQVRYRATLECSQLTGRETLDFGAVGLDPRVLVNGEVCAERVGLWGPWRVPVGELLREGGNEIVVEVSLPDYDPDSPMFYRHLLLGIVPDVEGAFAGIWQPVRLVTAQPGEAQLRYNIDHDACAVDVFHDGDATGLEVTLTAISGAVRRAEQVGEGRWRVAAVDGAAWSPTDPQLHTLTVARAGNQLLSQRLGFRDVRVQGERLLVAGESFEPRGALLWGFYNSRTPWASEADIRAELEQIRDLGFNCVKVCLFLAPVYFYDLCDELGLAVWQELPLWLPQAGTQVLDRARAEYPRLLEWLKRHPSIVLLSLGCELGAHVPTEFLDEQYRVAHELFPNTIVCANSGSGECYGGGTTADSDIYDYHFYGDVQHVELLTQHFTGLPRQARPWLFGEYNDADTWRTQPVDSDAFWLSEDAAVNPLISIHAGYDSDQPVYRQHQIIAEQGYVDEVPGLEEVSIAQSLAVRRMQLEMVRRRPGVTGYALSELRDTPNTVVGVTDQDGHLKYPRDPFVAVNSDLVLTVESPLRRRWTAGGDRIHTTDVHNTTAGGQLDVTVGLSNHSRRTGPARIVAWLGDGPVSELDVEIRGHSTRSVGELRVAVPATAGVSVEQQLSLELLDPAGEVLASNSWEVLVHPDATQPQQPVHWHDPELTLGDPDEVGAWLGGRRLRNAAELVACEGGLILTTQCSPTTRAALAGTGARVLVVGSPDLFELRHGSFWRENVKRTGPGWIRDASPTNGLGMPHIAIGTDSYVPRSAIRATVGDFTPLITRYDTRKFHVGEYLFSWTQGCTEFTFTTLNLAGGSAPQPSHPQDNLLGRRIVDAWRHGTSPHGGGDPKHERKDR